MTDRNVSVWISLKGAQGVAASVKQLAGSFLDLGRRAVGAISSAASSLVSLKNLIMGALVYGAFRKLKGVVEDLAGAYLAQEKADSDLRNALLATGQGAEEAFNDLKKFAALIQEATVYDSEFVKGLMTTALNLGITGGQLKVATRDAIGLSKALGIELNSAMRYVALAYQGEYTMLRRYMPALREETDATRQLAIIKETAARGFAQVTEETKTSGGQLAQITNIWGDLKEAVGAFIMKSSVLQDWLGRIKEGLAAAGEWLERNKAQIQELVDKGFRVLVNWAAGAWATIRKLAEDGTLFKWLKQIEFGIKTVWYGAEMTLRTLKLIPAVGEAVRLGAKEQKSFDYAAKAQEAWFAAHKAATPQERERQMGKFREYKKLSDEFALTRQERETLDLAHEAWPDYQKKLEARWSDLMRVGGQILEPKAAQDVAIGNLLAATKLDVNVKVDIAGADEAARKVAEQTKEVVKTAIEQTEEARRRALEEGLRKGQAASRRTKLALQFSG